MLFRFRPFNEYVDRKWGWTIIYVGNKISQDTKLSNYIQVEIDIPKDIVLDKKRLKKVQDGILKVISKGPYEEGLLFKIVRAKFEISSNLSESA